MREFKLQETTTSPIGERQATQSLIDVLLELERLNVRLRRLGLLLVILTCAGLVILLGVNSLFKTFSSSRPDFWLLLSSLALSGAAFIAAAIHDVWRKRGDTLFDEVSDEVQRGIHASPTGDLMFTGGQDMQQRVKVALRVSANVSDLPLVPGKFGPTVYAVINLLLFVIALFFLRGFRL